MVEAYPLYWPENRKRTDPYLREAARFEMGFARARDEVSHQIQLLCGRYDRPGVVISTNITLRRDGLPLSGQKQPDDPGVAVYFTYKKKQVCFACDRWRKIEDNMQAIAKTIDALRGVARWGTGDMLEAAFTGFVALPPPGSVNSEVQAISYLSTICGCPDRTESLRNTSAVNRIEYLRTLAREALLKAHPDKGGTADTFNKVQQCREILGV